MVKYVHAMFITGSIFGMSVIMVLNGILWYLIPLIISIISYVLWE